MKLTVSENEHPLAIHELDHLIQSINIVIKQAKDQNLLSIIFLDADNGNSLSVVVGGEETVLGFTYGHKDPPYYASKGKQNIDEPIMTCFLLFQHHTEFSRKHVIPFKTV